MSTLDKHNQESNSALTQLAHQLALNHINVSSYDFFSNEKESKVYIQSEIDEAFIESEFFNSLSDDEKKAFCLPTRNILVIGAGATFNSFENIPLATSAQNRILEEIVISNRVFPATPQDNTPQKLTLKYFLDYFKEWSYAEGAPPASKTLHNGILNDYLANELENSNSFLGGIGDKYFSELRKYNLKKHDYNANTSIEFETSLNLLSRILSTTNVRGAIKNIYDQRHGPTLFYHLVAHLFKHRFIDVIINFNFDELLDEVLNEELSKDGFDTILSDGDCKPIEKLCENNRLRQPLYIKPHGTASHKSSLRFTKDQYHELPGDMRKLIHDLLNCKAEDLTKKLNLITVGFELVSIEFNEILKKTVAKDTQIFSIAWHDDNKLPYADMRRERQNKIDNIFSDFKDFTPKHNVIAHECFTTLNGADISYLNNFQLNGVFNSLDNTFLKLHSEIYDIFKSPFKPRRPFRHLLICHLFGNKLFWDIALDEKDIHELDEQKTTSSFLPKKYFNSSDYFKDRTIVEVLISLTLNQGKINPYLLMDGIVGEYYSEYCKKIGLKNAIPFNKLLTDLGLEIPKDGDLFSERTLEINDRDERLKIDDLVERFFFFYLKNTDAFSFEMRTYLKLLQKNKTGKQISENLRKCFVKIFFSDNSRIQSSVRNPKYHIFDEYNITDLLQTEFSNNLNYYLAIKKSKVNTICIVADFGLRLPKFFPLIIAQRREVKIYLIVQKNGKSKNRQKQRAIIRKNFIQKNSEFLENNPHNLNWFNQNVHFLFIEGSRHNYHMSIFMDYKKNMPFKEQKNNVDRAVYYYKWGLSQEIDPVSLKISDNKSYALKKFYELSQNAFELDPEMNEAVKDIWIS